MEETIDKETENELVEYRDKMYVFLQYTKICNELAEFFEKKRAADDAAYDTSAYNVIAKSLYDFVTTRKSTVLQLKTQYVLLTMHRAYSDSESYQINIINCKDNVLVKALYVYLNDDNMLAVIDAIEQIYNALEENELFSHPSGIKGLFAAIVGHSSRMNRR